MHVVADDTGRAVRAHVARLAREQHREGMDVADDHAPARLRDPRELVDRGVELLEVGQGERAGDHVEGAVVERQILYVTVPEVDVGQLSSCDREHLGARVGPDHVVTERGQERGDPSGAARGIECATVGHTVEQRLDRRLLALDERVRHRVVELGPLRVPHRE